MGPWVESVDAPNLPMDLWTYGPMDLVKDEFARLHARLECRRRGEPGVARVAIGRADLTGPRRGAFERPAGRFEPAGRAIQIQPLAFHVELGRVAVQLTKPHSDMLADAREHPGSVAGNVRQRRRQLPGQSLAGRSHAR